MKTINYGIDLGTSNSCIAHVNDGKARVFPSPDGRESILPSAVMFQSRGGLLVGKEAYDNLPFSPERVAYRFKRAMGTNQQLQFTSAPKPMRPEDLSGELLKELKNWASQRGHDVKHAVVCTPAIFNSAQVDATNNAALLAGITDPILMSEPMAAAYGYGVTTERQGSWLIYDLGAGTFDAVVVQVRDGKMSVADISGIPAGVAGSFMDDVLWDKAVVIEIAKLLDISPNDPVFTDFKIGGRWACERAKIKLSTSKEVWLQTSEIKSRSGAFSYQGRPLEEDILLTRSNLESQVEPLIVKTIEVCRQSLRKHPGVSEIILVGGPTKMPIVREMLGEFSLPLNIEIDPMTIVAEGAALYASTIPIPQGKPVNVPFSAPVSGNGPVALHLDYEPASEDTEAPVIVRCSDPRAGFAEFTSASRNWTSGRIPLNDDGYTLFVPILPRKVNTFVVRVFTTTGTALECEPAEFFISNTLVAEAPPLPETLWVEVEDESGEGKVRGLEIIKKGAPLPAKGMVTVRTKRELTRGEPSEVNIKLFEGNSSVLRANCLIRRLPLNGDVLPRKLPANTPIEVTVKVDASRRITAEAYIHIIDEAFEIPKLGERADVTNPHQLDYRCRRLREEVESLEEECDSPDVRVKLELCRRQLWGDELVKALRAAKAGDRDSADAHQCADQILRLVDERLVLLKEAEQEHLLPAKWMITCRGTESLIRSALAEEQDRSAFTDINGRGERALHLKRWGALREAIREMRQLRFAIEQRDPEFWHEIATSLPNDPECYVNPEVAGEALNRLSRPRSLDELKADVVRLVRLLPIDGRVGREDLSWLAAG